MKHDPEETLKNIATLTPMQRRALEALLQKEGVDVSRLPIARRPSPDGVYPLSYPQQRLWFLNRLAPDEPVYNVASSLLIQGPLDLRALVRSLAEIATRHDTLRTLFTEHQGRPAQWVAPSIDWTLHLLDLQLIPADRRGDESQRCRNSLVRQTFDLGMGPLWRAALISLHPREHVLVLSLHHIICDGWSTGLLLQELIALYQAFSQGLPSPLAPLPIQYADYALWQREFLAGPAMEEQMNYWKQRLQGELPALSLPVDRPRQAAQSFRGACLPFAFCESLTAALTQLGRRQDATLFMVLLAGFKALLSYYEGQGDIVVGAPVANRRRSEVEGLIGFFVNTLVLRTDLSGDPAFREALGRVRRTTLEAFDNQDPPFEKLVEELRPERSLSRSSLFQAVFQLQNAPRASSRMNGLSLSFLKADTGTAPFDLVVTLAEEGERLTGLLEYSTDLFDASTMQRLVEHYRSLLESAAQEPDSPLSRLSILTPEERRRVLHDWNRTSSDYPRDRSLVELFEAQAELRPGAVAVEYGERRLSYRELNGEANRLARRLDSLGLSREDPVAFLLQRSPEMVIAIIAILKAGGAYLPLDPDYPSDRIAFMLEDSGFPPVLTKRELAGRLPQRRCPTVLMDADGPAIAACRADNPGRKAAADQLAYVMYTSGTSGQPKGIGIIQRSVVRLLLNTNYVDLGPDDRLAQIANACFDAATFEIWGALLQGGRLVGLPKEDVLNPGLFAQRIAENGISALFLTPSLFNQVAREAPSAFETVRYCLVGGDALDPNWTRFVLENGRPGNLLNGYGPTESTTFACWHAIEDVPEGSASIPIGKPLANTQAYVLNGNWNPLPIGVAGELFLGGDGLARGYRGKPRLTASSFIPHPFSDRPGSRLYRTGDRVRRRRDGAIDFLGRWDQQVKLRGFRVEPEEVEAVLSGHPSIQEAVVVTRRKPSGERYLAAFFVARDGHSTDSGQIREYLEGRLPEFMLPGALTVLESLPLTANGKIDRRALPDSLYQSPRERYVAPRSPLEEVLAGIWAQVLQLGRIGVEDNFFHLGGHSLLATQVAYRIRRALRIDVPLRLLFEAPTVAELSGRLEALMLAGQRTVVPALVPAPQKEKRELSFSQRRLWFLDQLAPGSALYNVSSAIRLQGALRPEALGGALNEILRRHEALRTRFPSLGGKPSQVVAPFGYQPLSCIDLSALPPETGTGELERLKSIEALSGFDLNRGPLIRWRLVRLGAVEHMLFLSMHHIVSDGWSTGVLLRELSLLYDALAEGRPSPLAPLPIQYADFAYWQRKWLTGPVLEAQVRYWKLKLAGVSPLLELPGDTPRQAMQSPRGAIRYFRLPSRLGEDLKRYCLDQDVTPFMALLAAFGTLLHRYSGQRDLALGSPVANRNWPETENLIGFFVNTLVLRLDFGADPTVSEFLAQLRETSLGAYSHQDVPFEHLVELLQPERTLSRTPLFQVMFALQNAPSHELSFAGLQAELAEIGSDLSKFDLTLYMMEGEEGLQGGLRYRSELFNESSIERMIGHFGQLLEGMLEGPSSRLRDLSVLSESERRRVLWDWNQTRRDLPDDLCIHQLFESQARERPEDVAAALDSQRLTYRDLQEKSERLARFLFEQGAGPEELVAVCMDRSLELVIALLAILKAGGAYLPLDPESPAQRLENILEESGAAIILTQGRLVERLPFFGRRIIPLDESPQVFSGERPQPPCPPTTPDRLCYALFTSGSTGVPKGVMVSHRSLRNHLFWLTEELQIGPQDRVLQKTPFTFDVSVWEFFLPLTVGARLVLAQPGGHRDPAYLAETIRQEGITVLHFVPAMLNAFLQQDDAAPADGSLRSVLCGGEALTPELRRRFLERMEGVGLYNLYGPTEATIDATHWKCPTEGFPNSSPIGAPIANVQAHVLDGGLRPNPIGVAGELHLGGAGLARGYVGRSRLTAERFVPDPYSSQPGARLYKSGDLARRLAGGEVDFLGRSDFQVKVRGHRVELGEIEAVLSQYPGVGEVVAAARKDRTGALRLMAYLTCQWEPYPTQDELRGFLKEQLPDYMVPADLMVLEEMPLNPNGKIDREALPSEADGRPQARLTIPRTLGEEIVASIWSDVLGIEQVGVHDNFFDLGGHSLMATQVNSRIGRAFGIELPLRIVFESPTVALLSARIESDLTKERPPQPEPPSPVDRSRSLPLSFSQQRLWFLDQLEPASPLYNLPAAIGIEGELDVGALRDALSEIVRRHESLRTNFPAQSGQPRLRIREATPIALPVVDLTSCPGPVGRRQMLKRMDELSWLPFDLAADDLLRTCLLQLEPQRFVLIVTQHHIVSDGWSVGVFFKELSLLYQALTSGADAELPKLEVQYADYAVWQRRRQGGEELDQQLDYWKAHLRGAPALLELPTDRPRPARMSHRGATEAFDWPNEFLDQLKSFSRGQDVTLYMTLLTGLQVLLHRYSGQEDICVGSPIANRNRAEIENLIGFFVNTLVLRTDLSGQPTFRQLLARVREVSLGAFAHQDVPFEQVVEALQPKRSLSHTPLFQVMLTLQNTPRGALRMGDLDSVAMMQTEADTWLSKFDLSLSMAESEEGFKASVIYRSDLFEGATIRRMIRHLAHLLRRCLNDPDFPVGRISLMGRDERRQLLQDWNATASEYPRRETIASLFEEQAQRRPRAVALIRGNRTWSYGQLNSRANRLAHLLRSLGIGPESLVGVLADRSPQMVAALLGVLKAGAAYLPLDPSYPPARLSFMLEDSALDAVVAQDEVTDRLPGGETATILLDGDEPRIRRQPQSNPPALAAPRNLAYVIYTSGSTGRPKGVGVPHQAVVRLVRNVNYADLSCEEVFVLLSPISFDASAFELWGSLLNGARLVVPPQESPTPEQLGEMVQGHGITTLHLTASLFHLMVERNLEGLRGVRQLFAGGDVLSPPSVRRALEAGIPRLIDSYGPSENATYTSCQVMEGRYGGWQTVPIGRPVSNTRAYVLDDHLNPLPIGVPGELYCAGDGLARGYHRRPRLTAERFLPDPFAKGERLYRSGDRVRWKADGVLEFLGRVDRQTKVRGCRVEPQEIEAALRAHSSVEEAVVAPRLGRDGERQLVAYLTPAQEGTPPTSLPNEDLTNDLRRRLPSYMLPAKWVVLDRLPLTPSGKVDSEALPDPDWDPALSSESAAASRDRLEWQLTRIWEDLLQVSPIGIQDEFFELGGHSLLALQLIDRIGQALGRKPPLSSLFQTATVEHLASVLRKGGWRPASPIVSVRESGRRPPLFLVHAAGGGVLPYLDLARSLSQDQPVYALQAPELDEGPIDKAEIERMAARHIEVIEPVLPKGRPCFLGGHSLGGVIAFEMARQLNASHRQVSLVALLDSHPREGGESPDRCSDELDAAFALHLGIPMSRSWWDALHEHPQEQRLQALLQRGRRLGAVPPDLQWTRFERLFRLFASHVEAGGRYRPAPAPLRAVLLRADEELEPTSSRRERQGVGWEGLASEGLEVYQVPGNHFTILQKPHVAHLAQRLDSCLARAWESGGKP